MSGEASRFAGNGLRRSSDNPHSRDASQMGINGEKKVTGASGADVQVNHVAGTPSKKSLCCAV